MKSIAGIPTEVKRVQLIEFKRSRILSSAELLVHQLVYWYDKLLGTKYDMDTERGMHEEEEYYLKDTEIVDRLTQAGFCSITKKYFVTQWGLNHLFTGWKY